MRKEELIETLKRLHRELADAESVDPETQRLLAAVHGDIERVTESGASEAGEDLPERLESLAARFESDHPSLAPLVRHLIGTLSAMGI